MLYICVATGVDWSEGVSATPLGTNQVAGVKKKKQGKQNG